MGNPPISAHITVVSTAPTALPDSSANLPGAAAQASGTDFSNLLASQIAARSPIPVDPALAQEPLDKPQNSDPKDQKAGIDPAVVQGLDVASLMPFAPMSLQKACEPETCAGDKTAKRPDLSQLLGPLADTRDNQNLKLGVPIETPDKDGKLPANFAAHGAALPSTKEFGDAVREAISSSERGIKLAAQSDATNNNANAQAPGLIAHGMVAAKTDVPAAQPALPAVTVASPVGTHAWGAELGQKVVWLANQQQQVAHINVTPPQLGPIEIHLKLASDQANAIFVSPHAAVRDAIEAALPQLRDLLAENGLSLGNVDVSSQSPGQFGQMAQGSGNNGNNGARGAPEFEPGAGQNVGTTTGLAKVGSGQGLVDLFA